MTNPQLQRLVDRDTFAEALDAMTRTQYTVAVLLLEGCNRRQIAAILGITTQSVSSRLCGAQRRIIQRVPELAHFLTGRARRIAPYIAPEIPPLEGGYLCSSFRTAKDEP